MAFNDFPRGYPYIRESISNVIIAEFENGAEQRRDLWGGKTKKVFELQFNVNTKAEITAIHDWFVSKVGPAQTFPFVCPIDNQTYTVRFAQNTFRIERRYFGTYFGSCSLVEVF